MNILICPDKFKGSLTADIVADSIYKGLLSTYPHFSIKSLPLADGGEGSAEILASTMKAEYRDILVRNPLGKPISAGYYFSSKSNTAIIEMAKASGWELLSSEERNPLHTSTHGTGDLITAAIESGAEMIILFAGGSATNDGGAGMLESLGFTFRGENGKIIPCGKNLGNITSVNIPEIQLPSIIVAHDVNNTLLGKQGATMMYAPQKGASAKDLAMLEKGMTHFCSLLEKLSRKKLANIQGMGAAGGISLGLAGFYNAQLIRGFELIAEKVKLNEMIQWADHVITGEGKLDRQTREGKVVGEVEKRCRRLKKPVTLFCGQSEDYKTEYRVVSLFDRSSDLEESKRAAAPLLLQLASELSF